MASLHYTSHLSANSTKWSNTLKHFVGELPTSFLSVFDHFVGLALKGLSPTNYFRSSCSTKPMIFSVASYYLRSLPNKIF